MDVDVYDPLASAKEVKHEYGIDILTEYPEGNGYGAVILEVAQDEFKEINLVSHSENCPVIFDVKGVLSKDIVNARL